MFTEVTFNLPTTTSIVSLSVALLLLVLSGLFSASEIAFFSLSPQDIDDLDESEADNDLKVKHLRENSEHLLATILIVNNFVNVAIVMLSNLALTQIIDFHDNVVVEFVSLTVILAFLLLLFGEIMPKIYSTHHALGFCRFMAPSISFLERLFRPFSSVLVHSTSIAEKVVQKDDYVLSNNELSQALKLTDKAEISDDEKMLKGIIRFGDETVKDVMRPRLDIVDIDIKSSFATVINCVIENNYSRIPVYSGDVDNIKGVLYVKDLLPHLQKPQNFRWQSLIRPPYFVPETKMIDDLLHDFQQNKIHIAIVVDEFGGTSGIVTMEDILEEIVGEINDEFDDDDRPYIKLAENVYSFEAKTLLTDFTRHLSLDDTFFDEMEGDADTLAGFLLELKGEFPRVHEKFDYRNLKFEIMEMDKRRILRVKVTVTQ